MGVDVEDGARAPLDKALVHRYCAPDEVVYIEALGPDHWSRRFLTYWTLKEAYLKARGLGIAMHLPDVCFQVRSDGISVQFLGPLAGTSSTWAFRTTELDGRHIVAVAAPLVDGGRPRFTFAPFPDDWLPGAP